MKNKRKMFWIPLATGLLLLVSFVLTASGENQSGPWVTQPTSIEDISCGKYLVAGKFVISPYGEDYIQLYAESDREFGIPLSNLPAEDSLLYEGIVGVFEVEYPLVDGQKQGRFYFREFRHSATLEESHKEPLKKIGNNCQDL